MSVSMGSFLKTSDKIGQLVLLVLQLKIHCVIVYI